MTVLCYDNPYAYVLTYLHIVSGYMHATCTLRAMHVLNTKFAILGKCMCIRNVQQLVIKCDVTHTPQCSHYTHMQLTSRSRAQGSSHYFIANTCILYICDWACENQPCERKLHRVIFLPISSALNVIFHFCEFQKIAH